MQQYQSVKLSAYILLVICGVATLSEDHGAGTIAADAGSNIVIVSSSDATPYRRTVDALNERFAQAQVSIRNVSLAKLSARDRERLATRDADFVAVGTKATAELARLLPRERRLFYCMVSSTKAAGVRARERSYGVTTAVPLEAQWSLMAELFPRGAKVGILYNSREQRSLAVVREVARTLPASWTSHSVAVDKHASHAEALDQLCELDPDFVWTHLDPTVYNSTIVRAVLLTSLRKGIPVFGFSVPCVRAGAMIGVGIEPETQARQAFELVQEIVMAPQEQGAPPASRSDPARFQIAVNLTVAQRLKIELPESIIARADRVFKSQTEE